MPNTSKPKTDISLNQNVEGTFIIFQLLIIYKTSTWTKRVRPASKQHLNDKMQNRYRRYILTTIKNALLIL